MHGLIHAELSLLNLLLGSHMHVCLVSLLHSCMDCVDQIIYEVKNCSIQRTSKFQLLHYKIEKLLYRQHSQLT
jgi:hypothetical protein